MSTVSPTSRMSSRSTWLLSAFLLGLGVVNLWWVWQGLHRARTGVPEHPLLSLPNGDLLQESETGAIVSTFSWTALAVSIACMVAFAAGLIVFNRILMRRSLARDNQRKADLQRLAEGLEAYYRDHGQYPVSPSFQVAYYGGLLLPSGWRHYDLPTDEVMKLYVEGWPIFDPQISADAPDQTGSYLYYPSEDGQSYRLYAALENEGAAHLAETDGLPAEWVMYNFKLQSGSQSDAPQQPAIVPPMQPIGPVRPVNVEHAESDQGLGQSPVDGVGQGTEDVTLVAPPSMPVAEAPAAVDATVTEVAADPIVSYVVDVSAESTPSGLMEVRPDEATSNDAEVNQAASIEALFATVEATPAMSKVPDLFVPTDDTNG